jgi:hypothetical protein
VIHARECLVSRRTVGLKSFTHDHRLGSKRIPVATMKIVAALGTGDPHLPRAPQARRVEPIA